MKRVSFFGIVGCILVWFVLTIYCTQYRQTAVDILQAVFLNSQIQIQDFTLRLLPRPAFEAHKVLITYEDQAPLNIESIRFHLSSRFFLDGKITFESLALLSPSLQVYRDPLERWRISGSQISFDPHLREVRGGAFPSSIPQVDVYNATISFKGIFRGSSTKVILTDLSGSIRDIAFPSRALIDLRGTLPGRVDNNIRIHGIIGNSYQNTATDFFIEAQWLEVWLLEKLLESYGALSKEVDLTNHFHLYSRFFSQGTGIAFGAKLSLTGAGIWYSSLFEKPSNAHVEFTLENLTFPLSEKKRLRLLVRSGSSVFSVESPHFKNPFKEVLVKGETLFLQEISKFFPPLQAFDFQGNIDFIVESLPHEMLCNFAPPEERFRVKVKLVNGSFLIPRYISALEKNLCVLNKAEVRFSDLYGDVSVASGGQVSISLVGRKNNEVFMIDNSETMKTVPCALFGNGSLECQQSWQSKEFEIFSNIGESLPEIGELLMGRAGVMLFRARFLKDATG